MGLGWCVALARSHESEDDDDDGDDDEDSEEYRHDPPYTAVHVALLVIRCLPWLAVLV